MNSSGRYAGPRDIPEKLQKNVRAFLLANPKGALLAKFCGEYRRLVKESLPWKSLGYSCAAEFLRAMPTAARLQYSQKDSDYRVYPVADSNTYLPSWQKKFEDKNLAKLSSVPPPPSPGLKLKNVIRSSTTSSGSLLPQKQTQSLPTRPSSSCSYKRTRDGRGGVGGRGRETEYLTLHICFRHIPKGELDVTSGTAIMMKKKLPEVLKDSGTPRKIYVSENGFAFVRFLTLAEALKAIERHDQTYIGRTWITVSPARESRDRFPAVMVQRTAKESRGGSIRTAGRSEEGTTDWADGEEASIERGAIAGSSYFEESTSALSCSKPSSQAPSVARHTTMLCKKNKSKETVFSGATFQTKQSSKSTVRSGSHANSNGGRNGSAPHMSCDASCNEPISQGDSLDSESDESWDEELLTSSPFSSGTELGCQTPALASSSSSLLQEWNLDTLQLSPQSVPNSDSLTPVRVSRVESPSLVWVQLTSDPESDVAKLSQCIARFKPTRLTEVSEGSICCAKLVAKGFRRIKVLQFDNYVAHQQVSVLQIDTGTSQTLPCAKLHTLPPSLSLSFVPPLAMPCRLAGISSTLGRDKWYFYDNQLLWRLIMKENVYVKKVRPRPKSSLSHSSAQVTVEVYLDSRGGKSVATQLVSQGLHIKFSSEEEEEEEEEKKVEDAKREAVGLWGFSNSFVQPPVRSATPSLWDYERSFCPLQAVPSPSPSPPPLIPSPSPPHSSPSPLVPSPTLPSNDSPFLRLQRLLDSLPPNSAS